VPTNITCHYKKKLQQSASVCEKETADQTQFTSLDNSNRMFVGMLTIFDVHHCHYYSLVQSIQMKNRTTERKREKDDGTNTKGNETMLSNSST
jgi:hypothetical protein